MVYGDDDHYRISNKNAEEETAYARKSMHMIISHK